MTNENTKIVDYKIIDDFLPQKQFQDIQSYLMNDVKNISDIDKKKYPPVGWAYNPNVVASTHYKGLNNPNSSSQNVKHFYMVHMVYLVNVLSPLYDKLRSILNKLDVKALIRIKCNLYPNSETIYEHESHTDFPFSHKSAILSINTCDGYTKLNDGTKIGSVANRILLFDGSIPHQSTTTSDTTARFNINFNYF
jgi:hypothetical protein